MLTQIRTLRWWIWGLVCICNIQYGSAQELLVNVYGRQYTLLNGKWNAIIDPYQQGRKTAIYRNRALKDKADFKEYAFEGGLRLNVPSDWNSQIPELKYYEGTMWYARKFEINKKSDENLFLYFGAVNYRCRVYLNGTLIGSHEGGFTPFQFNVTNVVKEGGNFLAVEVDNTRTADAIPALSFDWWNYGGITRDVMLVHTPKNYIRDYFIQLDKYDSDRVHAEVQLSAQNAKTTKYEHMIPLLAKAEQDQSIKGILILINTIGGDVECGLAIAELIASLGKPTVSLVLGGSHSIGVPLAVAADHSFIVKSATMMIHPVRSSGTFIGVIQSYRNIEKIQDRITTFISDHCKMRKERVEELMLHIGQQVKDVGTILSGEKAVQEGLIDEMGGMKEATDKLIEKINQSKNK